MPHGTYTTPPLFRKDSAIMLYHTVRSGARAMFAALVFGCVALVGCWGPGSTELFGRVPGSCEVVQLDCLTADVDYIINSVAPAGIQCAAGTTTVVASTGVSPKNGCQEAGFVETGAPVWCCSAIPTECAPMRWDDSACRQPQSVNGDGAAE